jgi:two-component system, sensor histidine kinase PdtaS
MGKQMEATNSLPTMWHAIDLSLREARKHDSSHTELQLSLAREKVLLEQAEEFEHRLFNSVQMIIGLLASQSRAASPEVAAQLTIAINRILAFGHVHRRLHLLDCGRTVQFGQFLQQLCSDLSGVFSIDPLAQAIATESVDLELPTALGGSLGFIISELVTNSAKHGKTNIRVRLRSISPSRHSVSVSDDGPGLPEGFKPGASTGLGMKIVLALVNKVGGELHCSSGDNGRGARFEVTFGSGMAGVEQAAMSTAKEKH